MSVSQEAVFIRITLNILVIYGIKMPLTIHNTTDNVFMRSKNDK